MHPTRLLTSAILSLGLLALSACSPSSLFGGKNQDESILNRVSYAPPNTECAGLDLSQSQFSVGAFRQLIGCLNSNHSIDSLHALVKAMPDDELAPTVKLVNEVVLTADFIKGSNTLFADLGQNLQSTFADLGKFGEDPDFGISALRLIGKPETQSFLGRKFTFSEASKGVNRDLLAAFEVLADHLTRENFRDAIDVATNLSTAPAFKMLVAKLRQESATSLTLGDATSLVIAFLRDSLDKEHFIDTGRVVLEELKGDRIYQVADELIGSTQGEIRKNVARLSAIVESQARMTFEAPGTPEVSIIDAMTSLFHYGHQPIRCVENTQGVESGALFVIREVSRIDASKAPDFLKRDKLLLQTIMRPVCDYPEAIARFFPALMHYADFTPIIPATELVQSIHRHGLDDLFSRVIGNTGKAGGSVAEDTGGLKRLTPILKDLEKKDLLKDIMLVATLLKPEQRPKAKALAAFLLDTKDRRLGGKSIYEIFVRAIANQSPRNLLMLVQSMNGFAQRDDSFFDRLVLAIRRAHYTNDYDVVREMIKRILKESASRSDFYVSLLSASYRPEFKDTLKDTAAMAKDGRLKDIFLAFLKMVERYGREQSERKIKQTLSASFMPNRAHELTSKDLVPFSVEKLESKASEDCKGIDLRFSLANYRDPRFGKQLELFIKCFNSGGEHESFENTIRFLQSQSTGEAPNRTYLEAAIDLIKNHGLARAELKDVTHRLLNWVRGPEKRIERLLTAIPYLVSENVRGSASDFGGPVIRPLFDLLKPIYERALGEWQSLEAYGAKVLLRNDLPHLVHLLDGALNDETPASPEPARLTFNREKIRSWVENKECEYGSGKPPSSDEQAKRVVEIENDYLDSVTSWNRERVWKIADHRENLEAVIKKLADLKQSDPNHTLIHSLLQIMKYFSLEKGEKPTVDKQFTAEELIHFFHTHATEVRLINYIYPGESKPRVRLASSLERLELIVEEADFDAPWPLWPIGSKSNLAVQFLTDIGMAWGDEPREVWPEPIQKMYPPGTQPPTLKEAVKELVKTAQTFENLIGFPHFPPCRRTADFNGPDWPKSVGGFPNVVPSSLLNGMSLAEMKRRIFNLNQVISIAAENLPSSSSKLKGGMRILRNLFYQLAISSPEAIRARKPGTIDDKLGVTSDSYNITFIRRNVQMGLPRVIGNMMRRTSEDDPMLHAFMRALIEAATLPEAETLMHNLFSRDPNVLTRFEDSLIWKAALEIEKMMKDDTKLSLEENQQKLSYMRQLSFYGVPLLSQLEISKAAIDNINAVIENFRPFLAKNIDVLSDLMTSDTASRAARYLYLNEETCGRAKKVRCKDALASLAQDALGDRSRAIQAFQIMKAIDDASANDPKLKNPLRRFKDRYDVIKSDTTFKSLNLSELTRAMVRFLEETPEDGFSASAVKIRRYLAKLIQSGEGDRWMRLAAANPNELYGLLETLSQYSRNGELLEFLHLIERNVVEFDDISNASIDLALPRRREDELSSTQ